MYVRNIVYKYVHICMCVCLLQGVCIERRRAIEGDGVEGVCATFVFPKNGCMSVYAPYIGAAAVSATHLFPYGNTISSIINLKRQ